MFLAAEKIHADKALEIGLVNAVSEDPLRTALDWMNGAKSKALSRDSATTTPTSCA
jgi:enoyl-CoA hydratase/carnithine racemase